MTTNDTLQKPAAGDDGGSSSKRARTTTVAQLLPPALRERYELLSVRGKGTSAEVWEARHLRTGLKVAIKILRHHSSDSDSSGKKQKQKQKQQQQQVERKKVEREVAVMRLLRHHPHIIRLLEAAFTDDHAYIVMELAEWGQLYDHVVTQAGGRLPEDEARRVFRQLVSAVLYCHRSLVVHRDLKMENVLLTAPGGDVKLVDFGFSKLLPSHTSPMRRKRGSPHYAAPELHASARSSYTGPQVDVWSCGVILYAMLCGFLPFDCDDRAQLARIISRGDFRPLPAWVSDDARDLIAAMLIVTPHKRITMPEVWEHRWLQPQLQLRQLQQPAPPELMMMPPASSCYHLRLMRDEIDGAAVEQLVTRHGFDRSSLLESLGKRMEDEAAVAYHLLVLSSSRRQWNYLHRYGGGSTSSPSPPPPAVATTSSRIHVARVLREMGIRILFSYRHGHRHGMVCCAAPTPVVVPGIVRSSSSSAAGGAYSLISHDDQLQMDNADDTLDSLSAAVFFEIQLYKQQAAGEGNHSQQQQYEYEVHLKRTSGPQPPYLRICSQIASKLRPQAV